MADEDKLNALAKEIRDQARFTRVVVLVCMLAVLAGLFYVTTEIFSKLPSMFVAATMENMEPVVKQWNAYERALGNMKPAAPAKK